MVKKLLVLAVVFAFFVPNICLAKPYSEYQKELSQNQKQLVQLDKEITVEKRKLDKIADEYNDADMALRLELIKGKKTSAGKELDKKAKKLHIRKSKADQAELRNDYYTKKKPLAKELDVLNKKHHKTEKRIKALEKKLDKISEGYVDNDEYEKQLASLRSELDTARSEYKKALLDIKEKVTNDIAAISDRSKKSKISRDIRSEAKIKEHKLFKEYQSTKIEIKERISEIKKKNKQIIERAREKAKAKQKKEKNIRLGKEPGSLESTSNFGA